MYLHIRETIDPDVYPHLEIIRTLIKQNTHLNIKMHESNTKRNRLTSREIIGDLAEFTFAIFTAKELDSRNIKHVVLMKIPTGEAQPGIPYTKNLSHGDLDFAIMVKDHIFATEIKNWEHATFKSDYDFDRAVVNRYLRYERFWKIDPYDLKYYRIFIGLGHSLNKVVRRCCERYNIKLFHSPYPIDIDTIIEENFGEIERIAEEYVDFVETCI